MKHLDKAINILRGVTMKNLTLKEVAVMTWPEMAPEAARGKLSRIVNGHAKNIDIDFPERFAKVCGVSISFLYGAQLSSTETILLKRSLRAEFDKEESIIEPKVKCFEIISIATKLGLPKDFVQELESDYKSEFV